MASIICRLTSMRLMNGARVNPLSFDPSSRSCGSVRSSPVLPVPFLYPSVPPPSLCLCLRQVVGCFTNVNKHTIATTLVSQDHEFQPTLTAACCVGRKIYRHEKIRYPHVLCSFSGNLDLIIRIMMYVPRRVM